MKRCPECERYGLHGVINCPVCRGSGRDPRNEDIDCTYCRGTTTIKCNICGGTGWLDDDDDYRA